MKVIHDRQDSASKFPSTRESLAKPTDGAIVVKKI